MKIPVKFSESISTFDIKFSKTGNKIEADFGTVQNVTEYVGGDPYDGSYEVTPKVDAQTMSTKGKVMIDDVTVNPIPFFNVSNNSGGSTVYIAKEM
jgi:hypothetical protein